MIVGETGGYLYPSTVTGFKGKINCLNIGSNAIYIRQGKAPDGTSYFPAWRTALSIDAAGSCADSGSRNYHDSRTFVVRHDDRNESGNDARDLDDGDFSCGADVREIL